MGTQITIYGRANCHLCDEMKEIVRPVARRYAANVVEIDIGGDEDLERRYGHEVPVLAVNGRKAFKFNVTARDLRRRLERER